MLRERLVQCRFSSWVVTPVQMVSCSRHCVVAEATQVRILVWTDNFLLNRFLEEEAHKQTIGKQLKLLKSMKKYPNKKQYHLIVEKFYHVVEEMLSKPLQETFAEPESILGLFFRSRSSSGQDTALWPK